MALIPAYRAVDTPPRRTGASIVTRFSANSTEVLPTVILNGAGLLVVAFFTTGGAVLLSVVWFRLVEVLFIGLKSSKLHQNCWTDRLGGVKYR